MPAILAAIAGYIVSGLVWRLLASIGFTLVTASFINGVVNDYIYRGLSVLGGLSSDITGILGILKADEQISIWINALLFISTYKSLKLIFVRKA